MTKNNPDLVEVNYCPECNSLMKGNSCSRCSFTELVVSEEDIEDSSEQVHRMDTT